MHTAAYFPSKSKRVIHLSCHYLRPRGGRLPRSRRGRTVNGQRVGQTSTCSSWDSSAPRRAAPASAHSYPRLRTGTDPEHPGQSVPCRPSWGLSQSSSCPWGHIDKRSLPRMSSRWHAPPPRPQRTESSPLQPRNGGCALWAWAPARSSSSHRRHVRGPGPPG